MRIKPTAKAARDFEFLLATDLDMIGNQVGVAAQSDPDGHSALECWYARDTHGATLPCREPDKLSKAERAKASWNLQVKLWSEDLADGCILRMDELREYCAGLPDWVLRATVQQARKIAVAKIGFAPSYLST